MKPVARDLQPLLAAMRNSPEVRAQLPVLVRELAEAVLGVEQTVDRDPGQLARMLGDLLDIVTKSPRLGSRRRQLGLFGEDGRPYSFPIEGQHRIVLTGECLLFCPICGGLHPLEFRHMNPEEIRNQPRCGPCRRIRTER
jgi:hypothetical protein